MQDRFLNDELMPNGTCFGCGINNPHGLDIKIYRDQNDPDRILGRFEPTQDMTGFPGITHGGAVYAALDCMATWAAMLLSGGPPALWVLRSAAVTYHRPALQGGAIALSATIPERSGNWDAVTARIAARNAEEELLVNGDFKVIPLSTERFLKLVGLDELPEDWVRLMSGGLPG